MLCELQHIVDSMTVHSFDALAFNLAALPDSLQKLYLKQSLADHIGSVDEMFVKLGIVAIVQPASAVLGRLSRCTCQRAAVFQSLV